MLPFRDRMSADQKAENQLEAKLKELGDSPAVASWLRQYGRVTTRKSYAAEFSLYLRWLKREKGVDKTPDQLVADNLSCVFESKPTDVATKKRHTVWLDEYVNDYLIRQDVSESKRNVATSAIRGFYRSNDSSLWGNFRVADQKPEGQPPALHAEDVRLVLLDMAPRDRAPLLLSWQSGLNIDTVLEMDWAFALKGEPPVRVERLGRKGHRRPYTTFVGRDGVGALRSLGARGFPAYSTVRMGLKRSARKLGAAGLLKNPNLASWHPHALRHSFETEASHAGVKAEIRDFWLGHVAGVQWVYNHRDEIHPDDLVAEYQKVEPYLSLVPSEVVVEERFADREKLITRKLAEFQKLYDDLKSELEARGVLSPGRPSAP